ncbi:MAG: hypothetical protein K1Y02_15395 [Candidatus Hydrogenedentes bacterium]|nr:hypothetical protein [Candidatus Hydrogenedentota bacterium]
MKRVKESKALLEVRDWKTQASSEVAHMPVKEALRKRLRDSAESAERAGFPRRRSRAK